MPVSIQYSSVPLGWNVYPVILIPQYVNLHVTLICLSAKMEPGVFIVKGSVMVCHSVMTGQINWLPNVTCVKIPSCSGV